MYNGVRVAITCLNMVCVMDCTPNDSVFFFNWNFWVTFAPMLSTLTLYADFSNYLIGYFFLPVLIPMLGLVMLSG